MLTFFFIACWMFQLWSFPRSFLFFHLHFNCATHYVHIYRKNAMWNRVKANYGYINSCAWLAWLSVIVICCNIQIYFFSFRNCSLRPGCLLHSYSPTRIFRLSYVPVNWNETWEIRKGRINESWYTIKISYTLRNNLKKFSTSE